MTAVDVVTVRLIWTEDHRICPAPHLLRGAVAARFADNPLFHQHGGDGIVYRYPRIQYRWDEGGPILFGVGEGALFLTRVEWVGMELRLGRWTVTVSDVVHRFNRHFVEPTPRLIRYQFESPWLPLSQENYQHYRTLTPAAQAERLDALAVNGVLLGLRGMGVDFPIQLYAAFERASSVPCQYKGVELLGFTGTLLVNADLPEGFALGRAVSHGHGWVRRLHRPDLQEGRP
jgi:hypothetical protein